MEQFDLILKFEKSSKIEFSLLYLFTKDFKIVYDFLFQISLNRHTNRDYQELQKKLFSLIGKYSSYFANKNKKKITKSEIENIINKFTSDKEVDKFIGYILPYLIKHQYRYLFDKKVEIFLEEIRKGSLEFYLSIFLIGGITSYAIYKHYSGRDIALIILALSFSILISHCLDNYQPCKELQEFLKSLAEILMK